MNKIVLVGFPGAGKSTVGKTLAKLLDKEFIDLDREIEAYYHTSIPIFIEKFGEETFRKCEYFLLNQFLQSDNFVLATGGGAPCYADSMQQINEQSISVYIKMSKQSLFHRLTNAKRQRPLVKKKTSEELMNYIEELLPQRELIYNQADIVVKGESIDIKALAKQIVAFPK